jgi:hypothetical protein
MLRHRPCCFTVFAREHRLAIIIFVTEVIPMVIHTLTLAAMFSARKISYAAALVSGF